MDDASKNLLSRHSASLRCASLRSAQHSRQLLRQLLRQLPRELLRQLLPRQLLRQLTRQLLRQLPRRLLQQLQLLRQLLQQLLRQLLRQLSQRNRWWTDCPTKNSSEWNFAHARDESFFQCHLDAPMFKTKSSGVRR